MCHLMSFVQIQRRIQSAPPCKTIPGSANEIYRFFKWFWDVQFWNDIWVRKWEACKVLTLQQWTIHHVCLSRGDHLAYLILLCGLSDMKRVKEQPNVPTYWSCCKDWMPVDIRAGLDYKISKRFHVGPRVACLNISTGQYGRFARMCTAVKLYHILL